jgi:signal peptidase I
MSIVNRAVRGGVVVLLLAAAWALWPAVLGGSTTYVLTHGVSMEPGFSTGDLAVLHRADDGYRVGDVVAYRSATLDTTVLHRIVAGDGDGFVTRGDNNSWLDPDHPTSDQLLGRLWLHVPHVGALLPTVGTPLLLALSGTAVLVMLWPRGSRGRHRARHSGRRAHSLSLPARARAHQVALGLGALSLVAAAGAGALQVLPSTQASTETVQVTQQGQFSYAGTASPGATYPTGRITTGDPVYTRLSDGLTVSLAHTVSGPESLLVAGILRLDVTLSTPDGWQAALASGPGVPMDGGAATASVVVDPAAAAEVLQRHHDEIGIGGSDATLAVTPYVEAAGSLDGRPVTLSSLPELAFSLDATALRLTGGDPAAILAPTATSNVQVSQLLPRQVAAFGVSIPIAVAQSAVQAVLAVALAGCAIAAGIARSRRGTAAEAFLLRHGARILTVSALTPGRVVIDVAEPEALYRVAERLDALVLHHVGPDGDTFVVQEQETTYRHVVRPAPLPAPSTVRVRSVSGMLRRRLA